MAKGNEINNILSQGNAISKVMTGGGIVWQKLYKWRVYKVEYRYEYRYRLNKTSSNAINGGAASPLYEGYSFDEMTGRVVGVDRIIYANSGQGRTVYYISDDNRYMYEGEEGYGGYYSTYRLSVSKYIYSSNKLKGSYIKNITDPAENKYPSNGIKGDYWYEIVE